MVRNLPRSAHGSASRRGGCLVSRALPFLPCQPRAVPKRRAVRAQAKDNCIGCHMPKSGASDAQHVVLTDHSIPRRPSRKPAGPAAVSDAALTTFDGTQASLRDQALAYGIAAVGRSDGADRTRALPCWNRPPRENPSRRRGAAVSGGNLPQRRQERTGALPSTSGRSRWTPIRRRRRSGWAES